MNYGPLAQLVEQATLNRQVVGSSPTWPTNRILPEFKRKEVFMNRLERSLIW